METPVVRDDHLMITQRQTGAFFMFLRKSNNDTHPNTHFSTRTVDLHYNWICLVSTKRTTQNKSLNRLQISVTNRSLCWPRHPTAHASTLAQVGNVVVGGNG